MQPRHKSPAPTGERNSEWQTEDATECLSTASPARSMLVGRDFDSFDEGLGASANNGNQVRTAIRSKQLHVSYSACELLCLLELAAFPLASRKIQMVRIRAT